MAKPMLVTLPLTLMLLDVWPLRRWTTTSGLWPLIREKLPLFALSLASGVVTFMAQRHGGAVSTLTDVTLTERAANAFGSYVGYLRHMIWPVNLAGFYPLTVDFTTGQVLWAILLLGVTSAASIRLLRRAPYVFVGWWWYVVTLVPVIGLVQVGSQAMADRYTYVPMLGILIAAAWGAADVIARRQGSARSWAAAAAVVVTLAIAARAHAQTQYWKDSTTFWTRAATVAFAVNDVQAHLGIGRALRAQGRTSEAHEHFTKAVALQPDSADAQYLLGVTAMELGQTAVATSAFEATSRLQPDRADAYHGLGLALLARGDASAAARALSEAARLEPRSAVILNDLGWALIRTGRLDEARRRLGEVLRLRPDFAGAHNNLGLTFAAEGRLPLALPGFSEAIRLDPDFHDARVNLARALAGLGRVDDARRELEEVLRRSPSNGAARALLDQLPKAR